MEENRKELLLEIRVLCEAPLKVSGKRQDIVMIPFSGTAAGPYFNGKVIGPGVDTQKIGKDGSFLLSARYMLEGTDAEGNSCRIFVENQGNPETGYRPGIVTDSPLLSRWETAELSATLEGIPQGVTVRILADTAAD